LTPAVLLIYIAEYGQSLGSDRENKKIY